MVNDALVVAVIAMALKGFASQHSLFGDFKCTFLCAGGTEAWTSLVGETVRRCIVGLWKGSEHYSFGKLDL